MRLHHLARLVAGPVAAVLAAAPAAAERLHPLPAAVHVHSDLSTGAFPVEELARAAQRQGLGALLLAENYRLRVEYGLPPFRALTRVGREERGITAGGLPQYLARVAQARRAVPGMVLVPGLEVVPHYHWTGSPLTLSLVARNTQKNLLVFGLADPGAVAALPVVGNAAGGRYGRQSLLDAVPVLLVIPGLALLVSRRRRQRRLGRTIVVVRQRRWLAGSLLVGLGVAALLRGWPFVEERFPPWQDHGIAPHQAVIDHVERLGGAAVWSFPEAPDEGQLTLGPVRVGWRTDPHPDDLLRTARYTAFGALYEQPTRVAEPGDLWDRLLAQYAAGERSRPAWGLGEAGYHDGSAGKRLGTVQTVFLVGERSEAGVLEALRRGRLYALHRTAEAGLVLDAFTVTTPIGVAVPGDTLRLPAGTPLEVRATIGVSGGAPLPVRLSLIRNGTMVQAWAGPTPLQVVHREAFDGRPLVLRLDARGAPPHRLLTSPVIVRP